MQTRAKTEDKSDRVMIGFLTGSRNFTRWNKVLRRSETTGHTFQLRHCSGLPNQPKWRPRFTSRALSMLTLLVALFLAWRWSVRDSAMRLARQTNRLRYAERELARAKSSMIERNRSGTRVLWNAESSSPRFDNCSSVECTIVDGAQSQLETRLT